MIKAGTAVRLKWIPETVWVVWVDSQYNEDGTLRFSLMRHPDFADGAPLSGIGCISMSEDLVTVIDYPRIDMSLAARRKLVGESRTSYREFYAVRGNFASIIQGVQMRKWYANE